MKFVSCYNKFLIKGKISSAKSLLAIKINNCSSSDIKGELFILSCKYLHHVSVRMEWAYWKILSKSESMWIGNFWEIVAVWKYRGVW